MQNSAPVPYRAVGRERSFVDYQDVLAEVGASSAHPGGASVTKFWQQVIDWNATMRVLDVGCGTGQTITKLCKTHGVHGAGIDIRPKMIEKATRRARLERLRNVEFTVAPAVSLPYADASFDVVYSESVNVFLDKPLDALREYLRVLRKGGLYVDVEMLVLLPVDDKWRKSVERVYGARHVPDSKRWKKLYYEAGFSKVQVLRTMSVSPIQMMDSDSDGAQDVDLSSDGAFENPEVLKTLQRNSEWMERHSGPLGYGIFLCTK